LNKIFFVSISLFILVWASSPAFASGSRVWDGGGANDNWSTAQNWDMDTAPVTEDMLIFAGLTRLTPNNNFPSGTRFDRIEFKDGAAPLTISGNSINLYSTRTYAAIINGSANLQTVNLDIQLSSGTLVINPYNGPIVINGIISGLAGVQVNFTNDLNVNTLTLSGANTYTGLTQVNVGKLAAGVASVANISGAFGNNSVVLMINNATAILDIAGYDTQIGSIYGGGTTGGNVTLGAATLTVGGGDISPPGAYAGAISGTGGITKIGTGTQTLSGANTYTGATTVNAGTLRAGVATHAFGVGSAVDLTASGTLDLVTYNNTIGSLAGLAGSAANLGTATLTTGGLNTADSYAGVISGTGGLIKTGTNTLTLSGANTYSGGTTISAGTLQTGSASAFGTGAIANNAILDIGSTQLSGIGVYTQDQAASKLKLTIDTALTSGKLSSTSAAVVTADGSVDVTIANNIYIPTGATFKIIDTIGNTVVVPGTINSLATSRIAFSGQALDGDLILTANRTTTGFASLAIDSNTQAAGVALDSVANPSSDMTTVLNTLEGLGDAQTAAALDTMVPTVDAGVLNTSTASLNNFIGASLNRAQSVLTFAASGNSTGTGVSSGDTSKLNGIWAKEYGSYLDQGTRKGIQGYNAWNAGTAIGVDRLFSDAFTLGVSGGYAYGKVNSAANDAKTNITSGQGAIYAGYQDVNIPYFIDAAGSFTWDWYKGKRDINIGAIDRITNADYEGQQYGAYLGGGYKFNLGDSLEVTPLVSIQWSHLRLASYTETGADSLNLSVNRQKYDLLQSGLGVRVASLLKYKWGNFTPELHAKWLYDFIGDDLVVTSTYTGGGGSFIAYGAKPAKSSVNLGGELSFDLKNDISLIAECDTELKDEFFGVYGAATLRYKF
jgi:autotransporter-associated beta strand protein